MFANLFATFLPDLTGVGVGTGGNRKRRKLIAPCLASAYSDFPISCGLVDTGSALRKGTNHAFRFTGIFPSTKSRNRRNEVSSNCS
jgi:hypothetical protein